MFSGFSENETLTLIPDSFIRHLMKEITDLDELKVSLYAIWRFEHMEGHTRFLREQDFSKMVPQPGAALDKAAARGTLLPVQKETATFYFLNSPRGRAAAQAFASGQSKMPKGSTTATEPLERPNIYKMYEENIGMLTPIIADAINDAEKTYPSDWVTEALEIAVKNNKRNWKYVEAILLRWKEEGHAEEQNRRDAKEHRGHDVKRKVDEFLKR
jgi:DNA replication protein